LLRRLVEARLVSAAHDCSDGGLAVALAEGCLGRARVPGERPVGATVVLPDFRRPDAALFGEAAARVVVAAAGGKSSELVAAAAEAGVPCTRLGASDHSGRLRIESRRGEALVDLGLDRLLEAHGGALPSMLE
ncbi:MAG: AIR synthase-related protein, partial [Acidobacteriota bacterium]